MVLRMISSAEGAGPSAQRTHPTLHNSASRIGWKKRFRFMGAQDAFTSKFIKFSMRTQFGSLAAQHWVAVQSGGASLPRSRLAGTLAPPKKHRHHLGGLSCCSAVIFGLRGSTALPEF